MIIRLYRSTDRDALVALWRAAGLVRPVNDPVRDIARKVARDPDGLLVAEIDGTIVGSVMIGYEGHRGWINYLGVDPRWRRRGIGRALVEAAEARVATLGGPKVNLHVLSANRDALAFYERIGYRPDDVVAMGRRLVEDAADPG